MKAVVLAIPAFLLASSSLLAWDGTDSQTGGQVEIGSGQLVRPGREIEVYDYRLGQYRSFEVESIRGYGSGAEIEVIDSATGEATTLEMD